VSWLQSFQNKTCNRGILICWDQWYPEAARITSLMGAEILFYPTAIGWATSQDNETNNSNTTPGKLSSAATRWQMVCMLLV